jgi:hypothetical protein
VSNVLLIPFCTPTSKMFRRAGGVLSVAIRRLCVVRSEGFLQPPGLPRLPDGMQLGITHPVAQFCCPPDTCAAGQVGQGVVAVVVAAGVVAAAGSVEETAETGAVAVVAVPGSATVLAVAGVAAALVLSEDVPVADAVTAGGGSWSFFMPLTWVWASPLTMPVTGSILIVVLVWIVIKVSAAKAVPAVITIIKPINAIVFISSTPQVIWREDFPTLGI